MITIPRDKDGLIDEEKYRQQLTETIKKRLCPLAGYLHEEYGSVPQCERGDRECPRPQTCKDFRLECMRKDGFSKSCNKMPGEPCPKNICILRMFEQPNKKKR